MKQPTSPTSFWITWRSALWAAMTACAIVAGLSACNKTDSGAPPLRELVLLAGTVDEGGPGRQDGVGTAARLSSPQGLALDAQGNLFVADTGNQLLRKITPAGVVSTVLDIATLPAPIDADGHETLYSDPTQVAFDPQGNLNVALTQTIWSRSRAVVATDPSNLFNAYLFGTWAVLRVASDGGTRVVADPVHQAGGALSAGRGAAALVFDAQGSLYTASAFGCTIFKGDTVGQLSEFTQYINKLKHSKCPDFGAVSAVVAIAQDLGGRLCFATMGGEVRCATASGQQVAVAQTQQSGGYQGGMVYDAAGNLYLTSGNSIMKLSPGGDWTTLAGNAQVNGSEDGMGIAARFKNPGGLALDREGNLFVADTDNHTIRKISPDGRVSTVAGMAPQGTRLVNAVGGAARFGADFALAADGGGQVYVADGRNSVVRRITPDGSVSTFAGTANSYANVDGIGANAKFYGPFKIAVDAGGNALVVDSIDLRTISKTAEVRTLALYSGSGVSALADGGNGTWLMVTHVMTVYPHALNFLPSGLGGMSQPSGTFGIRRVDQAGKVTTLLDSNGATDNLLLSANAKDYSPAGLAGDAAGRVVFSLGHAVFELSPQGALSLLAGQMTESGSADGTGALARFSSPSGLALDASGQIYVADRGNHTVRKITRKGEVSTVLCRAGKPGILLGVAPGGLLEPRAVAVVPGGLVIASRQAVLLARP